MTRDKHTLGQEPEGQSLIAPCYWLSLDNPTKSLSRVFKQHTLLSASTYILTWRGKRSLWEIQGSSNVQISFHSAINSFSKSIILCLWLIVKKINNWMSHAIAANYPQINMDNMKISPHLFLLVRSCSNIRHFTKVENTLISLGSHYF